MSRRESRRTGKLATKLAIVCGAAALVCSALVAVMVVPLLGPQVTQLNEQENLIQQMSDRLVDFKEAADGLAETDEKKRDLAVRQVQSLAKTVTPIPATKIEDPSSRGWMMALLIAVVGGVVVGIIAFVQGGGIGSRLTDLGLAVSKLGRGKSEVRVRVSGNDEVTALGRAVQYLATDLAAMHEELEQGSGTSASMDPQVREMRDKTLDDEVGQADGFEVDGAIGTGSRGGLDYYGCVEHDGGAATAWVVSAEGASAASVIAMRLARDELERALKTGATARKALAHTNRVVNRRMPRGVCAKASVIEMQGDEVKLYQAGYRAPLWICQAGQVLELSAEGLALGLDAGPVFEKGLRSEKIPMQPGVRLVQTNDSGARMQDFLDLVQAHSPKHTMPFLNLVLGSLEGDAGEGGLREDVLLLTVKRG